MLSNHKDGTSRSSVFQKIYISAKEKNIAELEKILKQYNGIDIYSDGSLSYFGDDSTDLGKFAIKNLTPAGLLASEDDQEAVEILIKLGANKAFIAYGYASKGLIKKVNQLIESQTSFTMFSPTKMSCMYYSFCGYRDFGYTKDDESFLFLLTHTNNQTLIDYLNYLFNKVNNTFNRKDLIYMAYRLRTLIKEYDISFKQAVTWLKLPEFVFWFLNGIELVKEGKLSLDALIIIGSYITPSLSETETAKMYDIIVSHAHRQLLLNDLQKYIVPMYNSSRHHKDRAVSFIEECKSIKTTEELFDTLKNQNDLFQESALVSHTSFFNWGLFSPAKKKHEQPYSNKVKDSYTETIKRHTERLQRRLQY